MVARGAKRPRSEMRGLLQAFQPLACCRGRAAASSRRCIKAEWRGGLPLARRFGAAVRLLPERAAAEAPAARGSASAPLRRLRGGAAGAVPPSARAGAGCRAAPIRAPSAGRAGLCTAARARRRHRRPIDPAARYHYALRPRPRAIVARRREPRAASAPSCAARRCWRLPTARFTDAETAAEAKRLMRDVLDHYLEQRGIVSRRVVQDLQALDEAANHENDAVIELGVNIDHVATLRQARRTYEPDPVWAAVEAHLGGADGITVHLREDRRHIQDEDVRRLRELIHIKLNLEMAATDRDDRHRVPRQARDGDARARGAARDHDRRRPRRGGAGGEASRRRSSGSPTRASCVSVFIDADLRQVEAAARIGARVCEVHTGPYAHAFHAKGRDAESAAVVAELDAASAPPARRSAGSACASTPGMRSTTSTCSPSPRCPACASCTSGTRSCRARCSSGCARRCGR